MSSEAKPWFYHIIKRYPQQSLDLFRHARGVAEVCLKAAECLGFDSNQQRLAVKAAAFHDFGKLRQPELFLINNTRRFSQEEKEEARKHPMVGAVEVLSNWMLYKLKVQEVRPVALAIKHHHVPFVDSRKEYDVSMEQGEFLHHNDFPLEIARLIKVADYYVARMETRGYNRVLNSTQALSKLEKKAGEEFDPKYVELLSRVVHDPKINLVYS